MPAGLMRQNAISRETLPLSSGDTFVLFSDGVSEALNPAEDLYGEERLLAALAPTSVTTAAEAVTHVMADVRAFTAGAKQSDDITVLAVQYVPVTT
jgi:sigma-B regulation protein RsbU (phosphoserine phosphatase)